MMNKNNVLKVVACAVLICGTQSFSSSPCDTEFMSKGHADYTDPLLPSAMVLLDDGKSSFNDLRDLLAHPVQFLPGRVVRVKSIDDKDLNIVSDSYLLERHVDLGILDRCLERSRDISFSGTHEASLWGIIPTLKTSGTCKVVELYRQDKLLNCRVFNDTKKIDRRREVKAIKDVTMGLAGLGATVAVGAGIKAMLQSKSSNPN